MLVYKWDIFYFDIKCWIVVQFLLVIDAFCFSFSKFETVFYCPFADFVDVVLFFSFKMRDIFGFIADWAVINV